MTGRLPALLLAAATLGALPLLAAAPAPAADAPALACLALHAAPRAGVERVQRQPASADGRLPAHCELFGRLDRRTGIDGQVYAIRYHLRLPDGWNGRFFFQGGSGTNGDVGDALGRVGGKAPAALAQGYAVVSQDSGHDNAVNTRRDAGGQAAFGFDPVARANYGGASVKRVADVAKAVVARFYGRPIAHSYFVGCSKGGQEGMAAAQRYPALFDGIVAAAPGFALPRAALAQGWDVQTFGALVRDGNGFDVRRLPSAYSTPQLGAIASAITRACDALDGLADGIVGAVGRCTWPRVEPELAKTTCQGGDACLSDAQVAALRRSLGGPRDRAGRALYADWPLDAGIGSFGWRMWKLGSAQMPALDVLTGGSALSAIFTVPPTAVRDDPQSLADYLMRYDFSAGDRSILAHGGGFARSAWQDIAARSPDLAAFRARGGRMIVPHGVSDPVFSINDTLAWYGEVDRRNRGHAADFVRVFPVPGMAHCTGGPATSDFDALAPLVAWVEQGEAPAAIRATAPAGTPWPGRERPLCPWPAIAIHDGRGSIERADAFRCSRPS